MPFLNKLFDQPGRMTYEGQSPNTTGAPIIPTGYRGATPGILSIVGQALSGVGNAFSIPYGGGDPNYDYKQAQLRQQNEAADMEFRKFLMQNQTKLQGLGVDKPIFTVGPDGNLMQVGTVPKGSQVVANPNAPTADMRNAGVAATQARVLWEDLKSQSQGLKGGYAGMGEMAKAAINRGAGESGDYTLYTENLPSSAVGLYRALTGDTRLSDADAKARALPLLWNPSQDVSLREKKNSFIDRMIASRERLLSSDKYKDGVIPFEAIKKEAQREPKKFTSDNLFEGLK